MTGINLVYRGDFGSLKREFHVRAGSDPSLTLVKLTDGSDGDVACGTH